MEIKKVGVVGCGLMGSGITQVSADSGYETVVHEINDELLQKGLGTIDRFLSKGVKKGKLTEDRKKEILGKVRGTTRLEDLNGVDLIVEAIVENLDAKLELYRALDEITEPETIFASNTSSVCITQMAAATKRPQRFVGLHFFNPVPLMKVVEVIPTIMTEPEVPELVSGYARSLGKTPIRAPDRPGFIVNRLLVPYLLDAIRALEEGVASKEDLDVGMKLGCGHPMGPFELLDFVGLDTTFYIANIMYKEFREKRFAPPPLLRRMVLAGHLGRKSGRGFYDYVGENMTFQNLLIETRDGIAFVTINRPKQLNALNEETIGELDKLFADLETDEAVKGVIITGSGEKAFVAGADIKELARETPTTGHQTTLRGQLVMRRMETSGKPVVAAINGFALGGGLELALACHIRVAAEEAKMGLPEVKLAVIPGYGGTQRLARIVGRGRALELILTGEMIDATEAHRIGLVNRVVPRAELLGEAEALMRKILANGPLAIRYAIRAVDKGLDGSLEEGLDLEASLFGILCATEDMKEGMQAFLEKREAKFKGQ